MPEPPAGSADFSGSNDQAWANCTSSTEPPGLQSRSPFASSVGAWEKVLEAATLSIICLIAVVSNVCLWLVVLTTRTLRNESNYLILCLSMADLLVSIVSMPITVATIITAGWRFSHTTCTALGYINMLAFVTSVESLGSISINRYVKICHPGLYVDMYTTKTVLLMWAGVWLLSGLLSLPPLFGWARYSYLPLASICFCDWSLSRSYAFFMIGCCFCVPCGVMTVCYSSILRAFQNSRKTLQSFSQPGGHPPPSQDTQHSASSAVFVPVTSPQRDKTRGERERAEVMSSQVGQMDTYKASHLKSTDRYTDHKHRGASAEENNHHSDCDKQRDEFVGAANTTEGHSASSASLNTASVSSLLPAERCLCCDRDKRSCKQGNSSREQSRLTPDAAIITHTIFSSHENSSDESPEVMMRLAASEINIYSKQGTNQSRQQVLFNSSLLRFDKNETSVYRSYETERCQNGTSREHINIACQGFSLQAETKGNKNATCHKCADELDKPESTCPEEQSSNEAVCVYSLNGSSCKDATDYVNRKDSLLLCQCSPELYRKNCSETSYDNDDVCADIESTDRLPIIEADPMDKNRVESEPNNIGFVPSQQDFKKSNRDNGVCYNIDHSDDSGIQSIQSHPNEKDFVSQVNRSNLKPNSRGFQTTSTSIYYNRLTQGNTSVNNSSVLRINSTKAKKKMAIKQQLLKAHVPIELCPIEEDVVSDFSSSLHTDPTPVQDRLCHSTRDIKRLSARDMKTNNTFETAHRSLSTELEKGQVSFPSNCLAFHGSISGSIRRVLRILFNRSRVEPCQVSTSINNNSAKFTDTSHSKVLLSPERPNLLAAPSSNHGEQNSVRSRDFSAATSKQFLSGIPPHANDTIQTAFSQEHVTNVPSSKNHIPPCVEKSVSNMNGFTISLTESKTNVSNVSKSSTGSKPDTSLAPVEHQLGLNIPPFTYPGLQEQTNTPTLVTNKNTSRHPEAQKPLGDTHPSKDDAAQSVVSKCPVVIVHPAKESNTVDLREDISRNHFSFSRETNNIKTHGLPPIVYASLDVHNHLFPSRAQVFEKNHLEHSKTSMHPRDHISMSAGNNSYPNASSTLKPPPVRPSKNISSTLSSTEATSDRRRREEFRLSASLLVVIVLFIVCWFPYCISMFVFIYRPDVSSRSLDMTALLLGYLNSCVNPIVYGLMNRRFKEGYRKLFLKYAPACCLRLRKQSAFGAKMFR